MHAAPDGRPSSCLLPLQPPAVSARRETPRRHPGSAKPGHRSASHHGLGIVSELTHEIQGAGRVARCFAPHETVPVTHKPAQDSRCAPPDACKASAHPPVRIISKPVKDIPRAERVVCDPAAHLRRSIPSELQPEVAGAVLALRHPKTHQSEPVTNEQTEHAQRTGLVAGDG